MAKTKYEDEVPPEWMSEEATRAASQAATGKLVNERVVVKKRSVKPLKAPRPTRVLRGWRQAAPAPPPLTRSWQNRRTRPARMGPQLIDEALDLLLKRYDKH